MNQIGKDGSPSRTTNQRGYVLVVKGNDMELAKTRRQHMIDLLQQKRWSVHDLARELEVKVGIVLDDLEHIRRSVSSRYKMRIFPAECNDCGFKFKERSKFKTPSRCPRCKREWISPTMMKIELA